jgi:hypothetical protein
VLLPPKLRGNLVSDWSCEPLHNRMRKRLGYFRSGRGEKVREGRTTRELKCCSRVAFARGARSQQHQLAKDLVGLCGEVGIEKETAAGLSFDGNRHNGEDKNIDIFQAECAG